MIFEYALEPELVASWIDPSAYRFFDGKFGVGTHRIACAFPSRRDWENLVLRALDNATAGRDASQVQSARANLDVLLGYLAQGRMSERRPVATTDWRSEVTAEHRLHPFQAILARVPPPATGPLVDAATLHEREVSAWRPQQASTRRDVAALTAALAPLLRFATEVRFVDPYFDAGLEEFLDPLARFIDVAQHSRRSPGAVRLELHTAARAEAIREHSRSTGTRATATSFATDVIEANCRRRVVPHLHSGTSIRLFVWSEGGSRPEKLHNRYVLTNYGSVLVPAGLDRARHGIPHHTDDFTVLSREQHALRWDQYREGTAAFKRVIGPIELR